MEKANKLPEEGSHFPEDPDAPKSESSNGINSLRDYLFLAVILIFTLITISFSIYIFFEKYL